MMLVVALVLSVVCMCHYAEAQAGEKILNQLYLYRHYDCHYNVQAHCQLRQPLIVSHRCHVRSIINSEIVLLMHVLHYNH